MPANSCGIRAICFAAARRFSSAAPPHPRRVFRGGRARCDRHRLQRPTRPNRCAGRPGGANRPVDRVSRSRPRMCCSSRAVLRTGDNPCPIRTFPRCRTRLLTSRIDPPGMEPNSSRLRPPARVRRNPSGSGVRIARRSVRGFRALSLLARRPAAVRLSPCPPRCACVGSTALARGIRADPAGRCRTGRKGTGAARWSASPSGRRCSGARIARGSTTNW